MRSGGGVDERRERRRRLSLFSSSSFQQGKKNDIAGSPLLPILPLLALDQVRLVDESWSQKGSRAVFEDLDENEPRERGSDKIRDEEPKQGQNQLTCTGKKNPRHHRRLLPLDTPLFLAELKGRFSRLEWESLDRRKRAQRSVIRGAQEAREKSAPPPPNDAPFADFSSTSAVPVALFSLPFFSPLFSSIKASTHAPARVGVVVSTQSERGGGEEQSISFGKDDYLFVSLFLSFFFSFFLFFNLSSKNPFPSRPLSKKNEPASLATEQMAAASLLTAALGGCALAAQPTTAHATTAAAGAMLFGGGGNGGGNESGSSSNGGSGGGSASGGSTLLVGSAPNLRGGSGGAWSIPGGSSRRPSLSASATGARGVRHGSLATTVARVICAPPSTSSARAASAAAGVSSRLAPARAMARTRRKRRGGGDGGDGGGDEDAGGGGDDDGNGSWGGNGGSGNNNNDGDWPYGGDDEWYGDENESFRRFSSSSLSLAEDAAAAALAAGYFNKSYRKKIS